MTQNPDYQAADVMWCKMRSLLERLLAAPRAPRRAHASVPATPGLYLFSQGEADRYVGQTRNLRARLRQHTDPNGTHYSATLAFLIAKKQAKEQAERQGVPIDRRTRAALQVDTVFDAHFKQAKEDVASWDVRFIEESDPLVRTIFEVYAHVTLKTDLNLFETH